MFAANCDQGNAEARERIDQAGVEGVEVAAHEGWENAEACVWHRAEMDTSGDGKCVAEMGGGMVEFEA